MSDLPPGVFAVLKQVWESPKLLNVTLSPRDAWTTVAVIQFATRNPQLSPEQREMATRVGRKLQEELQLRFPAADRYLEEGWSSQKDVSR